MTLTQSLIQMPKRKLTLILIGLAVADLLGAIDSTGLNVALPRITETLDIPISVAQWIPNTYTLALVSFLIFFGKLGDKMGAKKLYLIGLVVFGLSSLVLGLVNNIYVLISFRAIQGLGTAILYTMPMAIIAHLWKEREKAFAATASAFAVGMLIGPALGGILTNLEMGNFFGWHLVFLLNVPFVLLGLFITVKYVPEVPRNTEITLDYVSVVLLLLALLVITLSFSLISHWFALLGLLLLAGLYYYQKHSNCALLDFQLFKERTFLIANLVSFMEMVLVFGMSFVLTFYLQVTLQWSPIQAGVAFLPIPLVTGIFSVIGSKVKSWKLGAVLSISLELVGLLLLRLIGLSTSYYLGILPGLILVGAGSGFLMTSVFAAIIGSAPTEKSGSASGILNTFQQVGALIGVAAISTIALEYEQAFTLLTICGVVGVCLAFFVKNQTIVSYD